MSKTSLIVGLAFSLLAHGALLLQDKQTREVSHKDVRPEPRKAAKLILTPTPVAEERPKEQPKQLPPKQREKPVIQELKEVVTPPETKVVDEPGDFSEFESNDYIPELRLVWDNPDQLIEAAKVLGMRILLVDRKNQPVGEVIFEKDLLVKEFKGNLTNFSNRVRTISAQFFGPELLSQSSESIRCFWVLVPASVDQLWVSVQREAVKSGGFKSSQVSYTEARISPNKSSYELVVTRVVTL